jgi:hypothetical protein
VANRLAAVVGLAVLVAGIVVGVQRHDDASEARSARLGVQRDGYDAALRASTRARPHFDVVYVTLGLDEFERLTAAEGEAGYRVVPTPVAARLKKGGRGLQPDFVRLPPASRVIDVARRLAAGEIVARREWIQVGALIVSPRVEVSGVTLRLRAERFALRGFDGVIDGNDLAAEAAVGWLAGQPRHPAVVSWAPSRGTAGDIVPLYLLHPFRPAEYADHLLISGVVLAPRALSAHEPSGRMTRIPLRQVLGQPIFMTDERG